MKDRLYIATFSEGAVNMARAYGLGLELNHICISENLDDDKIEKTKKEITRDIEQTGGRVPLLHAPFTELCPGSIDHRAVEFAMDRLNEAYEVAAEFGIKKMIVHSGYMPWLYFKEWHLQKSLDFWRAFMADKPADLNLCIENVFEDEPYMLKDLAEQINDPRVGICLDIGHANVMTGKDDLALGKALRAEVSGSAVLPVQQWIGVLGSHIRHFHLHNNDGSKDQHNSLNEGALDTPQIFEEIKNCCKEDVTFTIESRTCQDTIKWLAENKYI